jgi:hypothetical protein
VVERHVVVDPYVLAVPSDATTTSAYVKGLVDWVPILSARRHESSFFHSALVVLMEENRFPTHDTLSPLLSRAGAQEYSVFDLLQMVSVLAATEPFFENFVERRSAAATAVAVSPTAVIDRLSARLGGATRDALVLAAVAHEAGWCPHSTYWATSTWNSPDDWVETTARVSLVELSNGDLESVDRAVTSVLRVLTETEEIEFSDALEDVYKTPGAAVALVLHRLRRYDSTIPAAVTVLAGDKFVGSLEAHGVQNQPAVLETVFHRAALAALGRLAQISGAKLHPVRTSKAANAPQVERADGAKLWRCMVTKTGAGYRLHYWTLTGDGIELDEVMQEAIV